MKMESHPQEDSKSHQLLDLTCSKEKSMLEPDSSESLVLDLSCKNTAVLTETINTFPLIKTTDVLTTLLTTTFSTLPADANERKRKHPDDFTNTWKSDQFQNSIMTQEESSKNMKNEQMYNQLSEMNQLDNKINEKITNQNYYQNDYMNSSLLFSSLVLSPNSCAVSMTEPILPNLLTNDRTIPKTPVIKSPATASLAIETVTSVSPLEPRLSISSDTTKKVTRPFKAYPRDPVTLSMNSEQYYNNNLKFAEFRKMMHEHFVKANKGTNSKMRRVTNNSGSPTSTVEEKDAAYWERRKKNNEAAKRSRDARRAKEDEIAIRVSYLERERVKFIRLIQTILKETEDRNIHLNTSTLHEIKHYLEPETRPTCVLPESIIKYKL